MKLDKKSLAFILSAILLVLVGFALGRITSGSKSFTTPTPTPSLSLPSPTQTEGVTPSPSPATFKVTRVIDGDTIELENSERVRYIGIDTPETVDPRKPVQCFGIEAAKKNKELVKGKIVRLEKDITDRDKYGRLLRYVYVDNILVNLELVKQGFATSYSYPPDIKYQQKILAAEQEAREAKRGLWGACPIVSPILSPTILYQETQRSDECNIKGNIGTSGEKIYHVPGCGSYTKTKIDENRGERWFCSEEEAQSAGWRKALNCP